MRIEHIQIGKQVLRVGIQKPKTPREVLPPLLLFNGIGANLELFKPFIDNLENSETIIFDVPGTGESPASKKPYRLRKLACLACDVLEKLGIKKVDVLGVSWGGALAQQFALDHPHRCRKLVLAATSMGVAMIPGKPSVLFKMVNPKRYTNPKFLNNVAGQLYGGEFRKKGYFTKAYAHHIKSPSKRGYLWQLLAAAGWTSVFRLPFMKLPTLILAGSDDPIIPITNAKMMHRIIPNSKLKVLEDGHLFIFTQAAVVGPMVQNFLNQK